MMKDEIMAITQVQKIWRGALVRQAGYRFLHWIYIRDARHFAATNIQGQVRGMIARERFLEYKSATAIQKMWRGYTAMEKYWHALGSAIQIQAILRGWQQFKLYHKQLELAPVIQRAGRCYIAREELARRKFILRLVNQVNRKSPKNDEKTKNNKRNSVKSFKHTGVGIDQDGCMEVDSAARTIQGFFRMVQKEVDMAIRAEKKKRRNRKEKLRSNKDTTDKDDELLENVWNTTLQNNGEMQPHGKTPRVRNSGPGDQATPSSNKNRNRNDSHLPRPRNGSTIRTRRPPDSNKKKSSERSKTGKDDTVVVASRPDSDKDDDNVSVASYCSSSSSTSSQGRVPKSRVEMSEKEMDEDFCLETAWMDTEVLYSKRPAKYNGVAKRGNDPRSSKMAIFLQSSLTNSQRHGSRGRSRSNSAERRTPVDMKGKMSASSARLPPGHSSHLPAHLEIAARGLSRSHSRSAILRSHQ